VPPRLPNLDQSLYVLYLPMNKACIPVDVPCVQCKKKKAGDVYYQYLSRFTAQEDDRGDMRMTEIPYARVPACGLCWNAVEQKVKRMMDDACEQSDGDMKCYEERILRDIYAYMNSK